MDLSSSRDWFKLPVGPRKNRPSLAHERPALGVRVGEHVEVMRIAALTRLSPLPLLLASFAFGTGCIITITDDVADDEQGESTDADTSSSGEESSSSESTTSDPSDTTDGSSESTTDDPSDTTTGDPSDTTTGDGDCDPMAAMNGPEECFNPRGWFWNGEACEQIICTCDGPDCNALFPDEGACLEQYGACLPDPPPGCAPQDAMGVGGCEIALGWRWNGVDCEPLSGCNCEGADCDALYADADTCKLAHESCVGPDCAPDDAQPIGDCALPLGVAWTGEVCLSISGCECVGLDCEAVATTSEQECWDAHGLCELGSPCDADDAFGEGPCDQFFGWKWNGDACEGVSGCDCIGFDCEFLDLDLPVCEAAHAECGGNVPPCPGITDAKGVGLCQLFLGYAWDGIQCVGISGCSCEGADCDNLYPELDVCQQATAGCQ